MSLSTPRQVPNILDNLLGGMHKRLFGRSAVSSGQVKRYADVVDLEYTAALRSAAKASRFEPCRRYQ